MVPRILCVRLSVVRQFFLCILRHVANGHHASSGCAFFLFDVARLFLWNLWHPKLWAIQVGGLMAYTAAPAFMVSVRISISI